MAKTHTTFESLLSEVNKRVEKQLAGPVAKRVENQLQKNAQAMATGEHSRSSGGIADPSNMVSSVSDDGNTVELLVKDVAKPQDSYFGTPINDSPFGTLESSWINNGEWMDIATYINTGEKKKRDSRPFVDQTQADVNGPLKGQILSDIEKAFK